MTGALIPTRFPSVSGWKWNNNIVREYASRPGENLAVHHASVSPGYFELLKIPLLAEDAISGLRTTKTYVAS